MCRRSKIRCGGFIYLAFFFTLVLGLTAGQARGQHRAAYWDGRYRTWWADDAITIIIRDDFEAAGYTILDADELKTWMDARIDDEATSVVVFCRDNAPDTVVESISDNCTLRRYLDAGGKIVWYSDVPVWDLAHSDGSFTYLGGAGCANILGITGVDWTNSTGSQATLTDDGIDWGLTETWRSERWTPANQVDIILASDRAGNAAAWVKHFVTGDTTGGFVRIWDIDVTPDNRPSFEDLLAVAEYGMESNPYALAPNPTDGVLLTGFIGGILGTSLSWKRGDFAVSHNVYFGDDFDAVNDGTGGTFQRNQTDTYFYVGYGTLGDPLPGGFVPGTTYYWRIDEVNDTDPNSPWKGNVWSLEVADTKAYAPTPVEGSKFINPNVNLSWESGLGMTMQTAYFGEDYDTVDSATAEDGTLVGVATTYDPGPLEYDTVYYWRVDTGGAYGQIKGDVWSFKTAKEGGGIKGEYFNNMDLSGSPVLTRIDPEINFYWNRGPVVRGVLEDGFSVRWTGELEAAFSEPVTFITGSDDGVRLYLGGELIIENWTDHSRTEDKSEPIELVEGQTYTIVLEGYENAGEAEWQLYWESPSIPRQIIPQAALSPPIKAGSPNPPNRATGVEMTPILTWSPGDYAVSHQVYFGTDADAVRDATTDSPEYIGTMELGSESYEPGKLAWASTYYWRVDEVNNIDADSPWIGSVWSFTTGDFLVIDDFEDYDVGDNRIFHAWHDGLGYGYATDPPLLGNGTGSMVGDDSTSSYTEETIVHSGDKSMPYGGGIY